MTIKFRSSHHREPCRLGIGVRLLYDSFIIKVFGFGRSMVTRLKREGIDGRALEAELVA